MSSPRLLVYAALALGSLVFPATGAAALTQDAETRPTPVGYGDDANDQPLWTADGQLSPGESVDVNFPLRDTRTPEPYADNATGILYPQGANGIFLNVSPNGQNPFRDQGGMVLAQNPYTITVAPGLQCGARVPLRLAVSGPTMPNGSQDFAYGLPTGGVGAFRRTPSQDTGNVIYDGKSKESKVEIKRDGTTLKGIRVHIDELEHQYSTYWFKLTLISPTGKTAILMQEAGIVQNGGSGAPTKHLRDVTFSMDAVDGKAPVQANDAVADDFTDVVIRPKESFDVFDGEPLTGAWKLKVEDISVDVENRRLTRGGRALSGKQMAKLGDWQLDTAGPVCSTAPATSAAGPEAWFGDEPLIIDPDGDTLDASASRDASAGGSIVKYEWDLDGLTSTGTDGFETTRTTPTTPISGPMPQGKREIRLKVTDNSGKVSPIVAREAFITKPPVITDVTINPQVVEAGTPVTITTTATDPDLPQGSSLSYDWDLDDDGTYGDHSGASVTRTWTTAGPKIVRVKVTDNVGAYVIRNIVIDISNQLPTARLSVTTNPVIVNEDTTLDASASTDADGSIVRYLWDFDTDGNFEKETDTPTLVHKFLGTGFQTVVLKVIDNSGGESTKSLDVDVTGRPVAVGTANPDSPLKGETVTFSAAGSHDSDATGSIVKYEWDLDGNNQYEISGTTGGAPTKAYPNAGTVSARLRVTDNSGATQIAIIPVVVRNPDVVTPPVIVPTTPVKETPKDTTTPPNNPKGPGGAVTPPALVDTPLGVDPGKLSDPFNPDEGTDDIADSGSSPTGFVAKINAGSKAKGKKVYKKGMAVSLTTNDAATVVLKVMITAKDAKTLGLKIKKPVAIGSGKLVLKKAGTGKFTVVFAKKYQRYVKKAKKTKVSFRAVVTGKTDDSQLVLNRNVVLVK